jgi:hypothetical protein
MLAFCSRLIGQSRILLGLRRAHDLARARIIDQSFVHSNDQLKSSAQSLNGASCFEN